MRSGCQSHPHTCFRAESMRSIAFIMMSTTLFAFHAGGKSETWKNRLCISKCLTIPLERAPSPSPQFPFWQTAGPAGKWVLLGKASLEQPGGGLEKRIGCGFQNKEVTVSTHFREGSGLVTNISGVGREQQCLPLIL